MKKEEHIWRHFLVSFLVLVLICAVMVMTHRTEKNTGLLNNVTISYTGTNGRGKAHLDDANRLKIEKRIFKTVCKKHDQKMPKVNDPKSLNKAINTWNKSNNDAKKAVGQEMKDLSPKIRIAPGRDLYNGQKIKLSIRLGKLDRQETIRTYKLDPKSKTITVKGLK